MIHGIGTDIVHIARMRAACERQGERFARRVLAAEELPDYAAAADPPRMLAKRFAAKEACSKALGTGISWGVYWRDMGVVNLRSGQPTMALTGHAAEHLARLTPAGHEAKIHLTLSDEHPYALAFVVIEALPQS